MSPPIRVASFVAPRLETDRLGFLQQIGAVPENVGLGPRPAPAAAAPATH